ncbi:glycosyltransferase [Flavobacterium sp. PL12]|uniref:glycosyltransferase n=1 Tax=Flavobacterium sp. PL12 TaxID=3071718 RepID=UPI00319E0951
MIKISIVLPNFNGGKYIEKAIDSFLFQEYDNKELIIVDAKSTDNSHEIINNYSSLHHNIIWVKVNDNGISNAFNIGLKYATGDLIGYLGCDDIIYQNLFSIINFNYRYVKYDAIYFNSYTYYVNETKIILRECPDLEFNIVNLLSYGTIVGWQNIYFSKEIYDKYNIDENNKTCMDYELYLRICLNERLLIIKNNSIGTINFFDNNISSDLERTQYKECVSVANYYSNKINYKGHVLGNKKRKKSYYERIKIKFKKLLQFL